MYLRVLSALSLSLVLGFSANSQLTLHHINVGQGDATILEFKSAAVLYDAGGSSNAAAKKQLFDYIEDFFGRRTDLKRTFYAVVISHPHADHTRHIHKIVTKYRVWNFIDNGDTRKKGTVMSHIRKVRNYISEANERHPRFMNYESVSSANIPAEGYTPTSFKQLLRKEEGLKVTFLNAYDNCDVQNNDSLVVRVEYAGTSMMLTGDAEDESNPREKGCTAALPRMLDRFIGSPLLDVDIYQVGHHGARNGTNDAFLSALSPQISIISAGQYNSSDARRYGHPNLFTFDRLKARTTGTRPAKQVRVFEKGGTDPKIRKLTNAIYCTCWDGDIRIPIAANGQIGDVITSSQ